MYLMLFLLLEGQFCNVVPNVTPQPPPPCPPFYPKQGLMDKYVGKEMSLEETKPI